MSKSTLDGYTTGEHLSKISESEILELSRKTKWTSIQEFPIHSKINTHSERRMQKHPI